MKGRFPPDPAVLGAVANDANGANPTDSRRRANAFGDERYDGVVMFTGHTQHR
jgi:hypothetical protein